MQWWNDFLSWFSSGDGTAVTTSAVVPFVAILVAGIVAAAIGRGSTKRLLTLNDRENRIAAVATMIGAARRASVWNTLPLPEQQHADHVASEADVRVRLLAVPGSGLAADWAAHEIATMKKNSVSFSFQAEQSLIEFRDRMVTWQAKPTRARKLFKSDLETWAYEDAQNKSDIVSQQQAWAAAQVKNQTGQIATVTPPTGADLDRAPRSFAPAPAADPAPAPAAAAVAAAAATGAGPTAAIIISDTATARTDSPAGDGGASVDPAPSAAESTGSSLASGHTDASGDPAPTPRTADQAANGGDRQADDAGRPALVDPYDHDDDDDDPGRSLEDALYSPPVTASAVNSRTNPPPVGDDGR